MQWPHSSLFSLFYFFQSLSLLLQFTLNLTIKCFSQPQHTFIFFSTSFLQLSPLERKLNLYVQINVQPVFAAIGIPAIQHTPKDFQQLNRFIIGYMSWRRFIPSVSLPTTLAVLRQQVQTLETVHAFICICDHYLSFILGKQIQDVRILFCFSLVIFLNNSFNNNNVLKRYFAVIISFFAGDAKHF